MTPKKRKEIAESLRKSRKKIDNAYESYKPYQPTKDNNSAMLFIKSAIIDLEEVYQEILKASAKG